MRARVKSGEMKEHCENIVYKFTAIVNFGNEWSENIESHYGLATTTLRAH